jgi:putative MATE family efflux protein
MMSIAQTVGIGAASMISRSLGAKNYAFAEKVLGNFFSLTTLLSVALTLLGMTFIEPILRAFGASATVLPYSLEYMRVIFYGTIFFSFAASGNNLIRAEGRAKFAMGTLLLSAGLNIMLDPIFIFTFELGIAGAAIATVISQFVAAASVFYYFMSGMSGIRIRARNFALDWPIVKEIFAIGFSVFTGSLMALILNNSLATYGGDLAIASLGVINRILSFVIMPLLGLVQGLQPVLGYNYGAKAYARAKEAIIVAIKSATVISTVAYLIVMLFTRGLITAFSTDAALVDQTTRAIRIMVFLLPLIGFQFVVAGMYQSLGKAREAFVFSILRQVLLLIPLVVVLPLFYGINGLWGAFPAADIFAAIITFFMVRKELKLLEQAQS